MAVKDKRSAKASAKNRVSAPAPKAEKKLQGGICLFSGQPTGSKTSNFLPGHDAKLKSLLIKVYRGEESMKKVPSQALPFLRREQGLVGFRLEGDKLVHIGKFSVGKPESTKAAKKKAKKAPKPVAVEEDDEDEEEEEDVDEDEVDEEEYEEEDED